MEIVYDSTRNTNWQFDGFLPIFATAPAGYKFEVYPGSADNWVATTAIASSGTVNATPIWLPEKQTLTKAAVLSGTTPASGPSHQWMCLLDSASKVVATSADATTTAIAASTLIKYNFNATLTTPYTGFYFLCWMVAVTTTMPTVHGLTSTATLNGLSRGTGFVLAGTSSTGQTTAPTVGNYLTTVTAGAVLFYGCVG